MWCAENGVPLGTTLTDLLLADIYFALTGVQHPASPQRYAEERQERNRRAEMIARLKAQRARLQQQKKEAPNG